MNARRPPLVLAVGGFDPSCGAGVVADARSIAAMGAVPVAVVTSLTIQSGSGLRSFTAVPAAQVGAQLEELFEQLPIAALKVGQVPTAAVARRLARFIASAGLPCVVDPVLRASGGGALVTRGAVEAIGSLLLPLASLLTVNLHEAAVLSGRRVSDIEGMRRAADELARRGAAAVLIKGGHLRGDPVDLLVECGEHKLLRSRRLPGTMHGTGCALASAAAARLAAGDDVPTAVRCARDHVRALRKRAVKAGKSRLRAPESY